MQNPFPHSDTNHRYYTYDYYLRKTFGTKCFKVPLDGGFTCPNIDGTAGTGGCSYCNLSLLHPERRARRCGEIAVYPAAPLEEQFEAARTVLHRKWPHASYIAYFQDFTNTYAKTDYLRSVYEKALSLPGVVGLNIATRADAISDETLDLLRELHRKTVLTVELGLQTVHDETAARIRRGHTYADFVRCVERLGDIPFCVHLINGLPGETPDMMRQSVKNVASLHPQGVKLHLLHILRGTAMAQQYARGECGVMTLQDYVRVVCDQIELLPPDTVLARLTGDGLPQDLIAPEWSRKKFVVLNEIDKELSRRNTFQGFGYL